MEERSEKLLCRICNGQVSLAVDTGVVKQEDLLGQNRMLKWFLKKRFEKGKIKRKVKGFPFCGECKEELGLMVELQRQLEELEGRIRNGVRRIREKMKKGRVTSGKQNRKSGDKTRKAVEVQEVKVSVIPVKPVF